MRPSGRAGTGHMVPPHSRDELGIIHFKVKQGHIGGMLKEETSHVAKGRKKWGTEGESWAGRGEQWGSHL